MVDRDHPRLSVVRQCDLVSINRSGLYEQAGENALNLALMQLIEAQFMETPWYGSRQMTRHLRREGHGGSRRLHTAADGRGGDVLPALRPRKLAMLHLCQKTVVMSLIATAWNNGKHHPSGAGYGLKISAADRDSYLRRAWGTVDLYLAGNLAAVTVNLDKNSFWNDT